MTTRIYSQIEFLDELLLPDLDRMVKERLHYYAFAIICQGIELLGAAKDELALGTYEQSDARFTWALAELFKDQRYRNNQTKFFKFLRGPLVHQLRPGDGFIIASVEKDKIAESRHLTAHECGATILIIEPFLNDFREAVGKFRRNLDLNRISVPKRFTAPFLTVSNLSLEYGQTKWDANLGKTITLVPSATGNAIYEEQFMLKGIDRDTSHS